MAIKSYLHLRHPFHIGFRRNNPGNLRGSHGAYAGETTKPDTPTGQTYYAFQSVAHGFLALNQLIKRYIDRQGLNTINKIVQPYTRGKSANDRQRWVSQVSRYASIAPAQRLDTSDDNQLKRLCLAIVQKETGFKQTVGSETATFTAQDYDEGMALLTQLLAVQNAPTAIALASPVLVNPGIAAQAPRFVPQMQL